MDKPLSPAERSALHKAVSQVMEVCGKNYDEDVVEECVLRLGSADAVVEGILTQSLPSDLMERLQEWKEMTPQRKAAVQQQSLRAQRQKNESVKDSQLREQGAGGSGRRGKAQSVTPIKAQKGRGQQKEAGSDSRS